MLKEEMPHLAVGQRHPEIAFTRGFWVGRVLFCQEGEPDPPFGHIFMGFMIMCMLGLAPSDICVAALGAMFASNLCCLRQ